MANALINQIYIMRPQYELDNKYSGALWFVTTSMCQGGDVSQFHGEGAQNLCSGLMQTSPYVSSLADPDLNLLRQRFSTHVLRCTGVPHGFLKHTMPDGLVRGTDLFSLSLSSEK